MTIPAHTATAIADAVALGLDSLRAEDPQLLSEWADANFKLAGENSHQKGRWESWPFQIGIMDWMCSDEIEELNIRKSKRVGYSKMLVAYIMYCIAHRRRKTAFWQPTDDDRDSFVKTEIDPAIAAVQAVQRARKSFGDAKDTIALKQFRDSTLHCLGGKAARAYRRITVDVALLDEWSGFDQQIEKSSTPRVLAKGRLEGAPYPKFVGGSTPRIKGLDPVEEAEAEADVQMRFNITCPHCDAEHPLMFGGKKVEHGLKWDKDDPTSVRHVCPHCRGEISQAEYLRMLAESMTWVCIVTGARYGYDRVWRDAEGRPLRRAPRHVAAHVWSAYSPQKPWVEIARECAEAAKALKQGKEGPMQGFVNEVLGETWELVGARSDEHTLQRRAMLELHDFKQVPQGCLILTTAVDTQDDRLEYATWGWGRGMESWLVDRGVVWGSPALEDTWAMLETTIQQGYVKTYDGTPMHTSAVAVDVGGHHTQAAYQFVRTRQRRNYYAIRGGNRTDLPILGKATNQDVTWEGKTYAGMDGVRLWEVGVHSGKDLFHAQLALGLPGGESPVLAYVSGPGVVHLPRSVTMEDCEQLTAEQRIMVQLPTRAEYRWVKRRPRNEQLDLRNYATFAAHALKLHLYTDTEWTTLRARIEPPMTTDPDGTVRFHRPNEQKSTVRRVGSGEDAFESIRSTKKSTFTGGFNRQW